MKRLSLLIILAAVLVYGPLRAGGLFPGTMGESAADKITYDNSTSGLTATNVNSAIDEVKALVELENTSGIADIDDLPGDTTDDDLIDSALLDADLTTWAGITAAANMGTFLATPSSANLAATVTDETGSGLLVFATSPTLVTPILGTPQSGNFSTGSFSWPTFNQNTTGTAANLSGTPDLPNGTTATTQSAGDNSTKLATTAYADALVDNTAYDASTWDGVEGKAPSKNAIRDYLETKIPAGADGTYGILLGNNTSTWTPGFGTYGYGFVAGVPTVDINNSQHALVATDTTQTLTNKTLDASATGNVLRQTGQMVFSRPAFIGSDTTQQTTATARVYGQTSFSGTAASTNNYAAYEAIIPWDFDADVALQAYFDFILSADQAEGARDHDYEVSYAVLSEGELGSKATSGGLTLTYSTMGAAYNSSGIVRRASSTSLTGWAAAWSSHKGSPVIIYVSRKGDTDNATAASYSKGLTIVYGSEQEGPIIPAAGGSGTWVYSNSHTPTSGDSTAVIKNHIHVGDYIVAPAGTTKITKLRWAVSDGASARNIRICVYPQYSVNSIGGGTSSTPGSSGGFMFADTGTLDISITAGSTYCVLASPSGDIDGYKSATNGLYDIDAYSESACVNDVNIIEDEGDGHCVGAYFE